MPKKVVLRLPPIASAAHAETGESPRNSPRRQAKHAKSGDSSSCSPQSNAGSPRRSEKQAGAAQMQAGASPSKRIKPERLGDSSVSSPQSFAGSPQRSGKQEGEKASPMSPRQRGTLKLLDDSLKLATVSNFTPQFTEDDHWEVQSPEQILEEVKQVVQGRKPWRERPDDSLLEKKSKMDRGSHIPLPDIRVRLMEDELSLRVRCELLDEEMPPPSPPKWQPKAKAKATRKVQNPWYLPAKSWFLQDNADNPEEGNANFPYANVVYRLSDSDAPQTQEQIDLQQSAMLHKETLGMIDAYKHFMKGNRLPHFLQ